MLQYLLPTLADMFIWYQGISGSFVTDKILVIVKLIQNFGNIFTFAFLEHKVMKEAESS